MKIKKYSYLLLILFSAPVFGDNALVNVANQGTQIMTISFFSPKKEISPGANYSYTVPSNTSNTTNNIVNVAVYSDYSNKTGNIGDNVLGIYMVNVNADASQIQVWLDQCESLSNASLDKIIDNSYCNNKIKINHENMMSSEIDFKANNTL